jgi:hypothetical protein
MAGAGVSASRSCHHRSAGRAFVRPFIFPANRLLSLGFEKPRPTGGAAARIQLFVGQLRLDLRQTAHLKTGVPCL